MRAAAALALAIASLAGAQPRLHAQSAYAEFIPAGWKLQRAIDASLTDAAARDVVLELLEVRDAPPVLRTMLVVLRRTATGAFERVAASRPFVRPEVSIARGVLIVVLPIDGQPAGTWLQRYRYDASTKRFLLIGEDYSLGASQVYYVSANHLTGKRIIERRRRDRSNKYVVVASETAAMEPVRGSLEEPLSPWVTRWREFEHEKLCLAGKAAGFFESDLGIFEPGLREIYQCAAADAMWPDFNFRFEVRANNSGPEAVSIEVIPTAAKPMATIISGKALPVLRAVFEIAGGAIPPEVLAAIESVKDGRFVTFMGTVTLKNETSPTRGYTIRIALPLPPW